MIVPMKKLAVLVQNKDALIAAGKLASMGVLHVENQKMPKGRDIDVLLEDIALLEKATNILRRFESEKHSSQRKFTSGWKNAATHIADLNDRLARLDEYRRVTERKINEWEVWGDFDPEKVKALEEKNIFVRLCIVPAKRMKEFSSSAIVKKLSTIKGLVYCAVIAEGEKPELPFKEMVLPKIGLNRMREKFFEDKKVVDSIKNDLKKATLYLGALTETKKSLENELKFQEAACGMGSSGNISYITGYIPNDTTSKLSEQAALEKWGIFITDPSEDDKVPTLVRNPRWISIIDPVFKMIDIVPGYKELDISFWFLVFFSIFFGMLIGDAAYGAIFFLLTAWAQIKFGKKSPNKSVFFLLYLLSLCAIIWGVLTATFFGQAWLPAGVKPLVPALRDSRSLQILCFFLGSLQLGIAHLWRALRKAPHLSALSDIGWATILCGVFFLAKTLILGDNFPYFGKWLFITGSILVILFTNPQRNIIKGIGSGFGSILLNFINSFTDVVSYIRLFAVGLATVAIADAFNAMAASVGFNSIFSGLLAALILFIGHGLNIILGPLAVLVHGVRLNVLEFCNHVDVKWSGFHYNPLQRKGD